VGERENGSEWEEEETREVGEKGRKRKECKSDRRIGREGGWRIEREGGREGGRQEGRRGRGSIGQEITKKGRERENNVGHTNKRHGQKDQLTATAVL
jgi:hypothetical protein